MIRSATIWTRHPTKARHATPSKRRRPCGYDDVQKHSPCAKKSVPISSLGLEVKDLRLIQGLRLEGSRWPLGLLEVSCLVDRSVTGIFEYKCHEVYL